MNTLGFRNPALTANAWSPARIQNLAGYFHFKLGNCYESNGGSLTAYGNDVGYVPSSFGATLSASETTEKGHLEADGWEPESGFDWLTLSSPFVAGNATIYISHICPVGNLALLLGNASNSAYLALAGGSVAWTDDTGSSSSDGSLTESSVSLFRFDRDSGTGDVNIHCTGLTPPMSVSGTSLFTFDQIGAASGSSAWSDSVTRIRMVMLINRRIVYDSPEDLLIRNWFMMKDGATL